MTKKLTKKHASILLLVLPILIIGIAWCHTLLTSHADTTYVPPIGIPTPSFGIEETYRMYEPSQ